jgi:hypothetical protein
MLRGERITGNTLAREPVGNPSAANPDGNSGQALREAPHSVRSSDRIAPPAARAM